MSDKISIAIDGPAGAGKSTIAKRAAKELGFTYIDTGAMYRTMAYYYLNKGIAPDSKDAVEDECANIEVGLKYIDGAQHVFLNGEDVTAYIRTPEVGEAASQISVYPAVRSSLLDLQRNMAKTDNVVMDGRDIGSVVLPDAKVKVYLTASVEERANRRYKEYVAAGRECDLEKIKQEIEERDHRDMTREIAPLVCAEGATVVDSSDMTIDEVCNEIFRLVKEAGYGEKEA
jgi:cytidylate kinase